MCSIEPQARNAVVALDARGLLQPRGQVLAHFAQHGNLALDDVLFFAIGHVPGDVVDEAPLGFLVENLLPQRAWGVEVLGPNFREKGDGRVGELTVLFIQIDGALSKTDRLDGREIVGAGTLVLKSHTAIALKVRDAVGGSGRLHGGLLVVDADPMAMLVRIGEKTTLEYGVGRRFNARDEMSRVESHLLDLGKVVFTVFVGSEFTYFAERKLLLGSNMGEIKDVDCLSPQSFSASLAVMV